MKIEVLGPGCKNCEKLMQDVQKALGELNIQANVIKITDIREFSSYGILMTPGLVINGKVYSSGKIPAMAILKKWIEDENRE
ncbi:MAG TPA: thioredoxin family protein [candidate division Zixibacteria bacterium]